jgi:hypothetical protein
MRRSLDPRRAAAIAANSVIPACAASAGVHAGLVPEHLREEPALGVAFIVAAALLAAAAIVVSARPAGAVSSRAAAALLAGLIVSYVASRSTGIPLLQPEPEAVDAVGIATNLVELAGLAAALSLSHTAGGRRVPAEKEVAR